MPKKKAPQIEISLTPDQQRVLTAVNNATEQGRRLFVLWYGGIRAGKSTGAALAMLAHSSKRKNATYMIAAHTQRQGINIFMPIFQEYANRVGETFRGVKGSSPYMEIGSNVFLIVGGSDTGRDMAIQGLTLSGLLLDEIPNLHPEFISQAEARISANAALRIYTANKTNPYHWTTLRYYNRAKSGEIDALLIDSDTQDNQFVSQDFIDEKKSEYDELHYDRFIANKFRLDREPLYQPLYEMAGGSADISVICGISGVSQILDAVKIDGGCCIINQRELKAGEFPSELGAIVLVNSERPYLAKELRKAGHSVKGYVSGYEARRIECTQHAMATGKLRVSPSLQSLTQAIDEYNLAGMYPNEAIRGVEALGEYIAKRSDYAVS